MSAYLCTLAYGFNRGIPIHTIETTVTQSWTSSFVHSEAGVGVAIHDEWLLSFRNSAGGPLLASIKSSDLPPTCKSWLPLMLNNIVQPRAVFVDSVRPDNLVAVRLYSRSDGDTGGRSDGRSADAEFGLSLSCMKSESLLMRCLTGGPSRGPSGPSGGPSGVVYPAGVETPAVVVEPDFLVTDKKPPRCYTGPTEVSVPQTIPIRAGFGLSMQTFGLEPWRAEDKVTACLRPVVVAHKVANRITPALNLAMQDATADWHVLVITEDPQAWADKCTAQHLAAKVLGGAPSTASAASAGPSEASGPSAGPSGLSRADLATYTVFILPVDAVEQATRDLDQSIEAFTDAVGMVTGSTPTENQVKRFITWSFLKRYDSCVSPLLFSWSCLVLDGGGPNGSVGGPFGPQGRHGRHLTDTIRPCRLVRVHITDTIRPSYPSLEQMCDLHECTPAAMRVLLPHAIRSTHLVGVPRAILKRLKVKVEHVHLNVAETRLLRLERHLRGPARPATGGPSGFDVRASVPRVMKRLSPGAWTPSDALEALRDVFTAKAAAAAPAASGSMAQLIEGTNTFQAAAPFVLSQVEAHETSCGVCFESCAGEHGDERTLTICGHSFCVGCSVQLFGALVDDPTLVTQCPYCRDHLSVGDLFVIDVNKNPNDPEPLGGKAAFMKSRSFRNFTLVDPKGALGPAVGLSERPAAAKHVVIASGDVTDADAMANWLLEAACGATGRNVKVTFLQSPVDEPWVSKITCLLRG